MGLKDEVLFVFICVHSCFQISPEVKCELQQSNGNTNGHE
jgi:hypothetical protein